MRILDMRYAQHAAEVIISDLTARK